jgi:hypothetical protein
VVYFRTYLSGCFHTGLPRATTTNGLTMRCSQPRPAPMRKFFVVSSFSLQPRALSGAVADLGSCYV